MTSQQPQFLSQSVNYLGFLAQQLGDLTGKTTLAHELIQDTRDTKDDSGRLAGIRIWEVVGVLRMETINPVPTTGSH